MTSPQITIVHVKTFPASTFDEFLRVVDHENLTLEVESRSKFGGPMAGVEWLLPTAVFVYLGKSYFDGFLKEMGKDHYALLKTGLKSLYSALLGPTAPKVEVITAGKVSKSRRYSLLYSVVAEADVELKFKLLLPQSCTEAEYEATLVAFLEFLDHFYDHRLGESTIARLSSVKLINGTILVWFNPKTGVIEPVDPMQRDI